MIVKYKKKNFTAILKTLSANNNGIISANAAENAGISRAMLSLMSIDGRIERVSKGIYMLPDSIPDELYILSLYSKNIVFSHETALFLHGITERTPAFNSFTLPNGKRRSSALSKKCKIHHVKDEYFNIGKTTIKTFQGNEVPCYDLERTVCDIIRDKNKLDPETYLTSIKMYAISKNKDLTKLSSYAEKMGLVKKVRRALEVLL
ncbi:MAG: type IV toxin-antitoxin system AbiEi family antitoxin domain-containing protein [Spirochaetia bacterium]|nr:type IV toxin-antitoxin system AbiEi family antitoxin domain-containing protein [Spirochaetia bacterium]